MASPPCTSTQLDEERQGDRRTAPRQNASTGVWVFPSNLKVLNLSRTGLGDTGACHIAEALLPRWSRSRSWAAARAVGGVQLEAARVAPGRRHDRPGGAKALARAHPAAQQRLRRRQGRVVVGVQHRAATLDLRDNQIGSEGMEAIAADARARPGRRTCAQSPNSGSSTPGAFNPNVFPTPPTPPTPRRTRARDENGRHRPARSRTRWISGGGGPTVLNLEFNDAGPRGSATSRGVDPAVVRGAPAGPRQPRPGRSSPASPSTRRARHWAGSPDSSNASSPGATPYGSRPSSARGARRVYQPGVAPEPGWWIRRRGTNGGAQTLCWLNSATDTGSPTARCGVSPWRKPMGNEGAAALATAIEPRMNSDGSWATPALHASTPRRTASAPRASGAGQGLGARRPMPPRYDQQAQLTDSLASLDECRSVRPGSTHGASLLSSVLLNNAANAAGDVVGLMNQWGFGGNSRRTARGALAHVRHRARLAVPGGLTEGWVPHG